MIDCLTFPAQQAVLWRMSGQAPRGGARSGAVGHTSYTPGLLVNIKYNEPEFSGAQLRIYLGLV